MKLNKFKKMLMVTGAVIAIAPVATVTAVSSSANTQTVQAKRRARYRILTKRIKTKNSWTYAHYYIPAGQIYDLNLYENIGKNRYAYKYNDSLSYYVRTFTRQNTKSFNSYAKAKAYSRKHFPEIWGDIPDSQLTKVQLKRRHWIEKQDKKDGIWQDPSNWQIDFTKPQTNNHQNGSYTKKLNKENKDIDGIENPLE